MASVRAEVKELIDAVRANGYQVEMPQGGRAEAKIFYHGEPALSDTGVPLTLHTTPSDHRWRENEVARLKRAGVLQEDPKKAGQRAQTSSRVSPSLEDRLTSEARKREVASNSRVRQAKTNALRGRMEHVLKPIGVWKVAGKGHSGWKGTVAEVARVAFFWGSTQQSNFPTEGAAKTSMRTLFEGSTIKEPAQRLWGAFLDELETSSDPRDRYFELLKGLTSTMPPSRLKEPDKRIEGGDEQVPRRKTSTRPTPAIGNFAADQRQIREELEAVRGPMEQRLADLREREKALGEALRETVQLREETEAIVKAFKPVRAHRTESDRARPRKVGKGSRPRTGPYMTKAARIEMAASALRESPNGGLSSRELREVLGWPEGTTRGILVRMEEQNMLVRSGDPNRPTYSLA